MNSKNLSKSIRVRLIDFAHVFPANGERDDNFLFGLENILRLFENSLTAFNAKLTTNGNV